MNGPICGAQQPSGVPDPFDWWPIAAIGTIVSRPRTPVLATELAMVPFQETLLFGVRAQAVVHVNGAHAGNVAQLVKQDYGIDAARKGDRNAPSATRELPATGRSLP